MELKIDKKFFIKLGIIIVFGFSCFCAGRFIRLSGVDGVHGELEQGIILAGDSASRLLDELGIARPAGQSAYDTGYTVLEGIERLRRANEAKESCINEIIRETNDYKQNSNIISTSAGDAIDTIQYVLQLSIEQANTLEAIDGTLQQFNNNIAENEQKSITGSGDSE